MNTIKDEAGAAPGTITLEEKVAFLKSPETYSTSTGRVETVKTHMSWVFLTEQYVYKLKIPFRYDHMQLLTPQDRYKNCREEVRLNKRLADDIYLGIIPLSVDKEGRLRLGRGERITDWLVKMKRLSADRMLKHRITAAQALSEEELKPAARLLADFYMKAEPEAVTHKEYCQQLEEAVEHTCRELHAPEFELQQTDLTAVCRKQLAFIRDNKGLLSSRIDKGKIIEGHGDLKPDHICLSPPAVIDCLEFDKQLRILDILDDLSFLSLECERLGSPGVGSFFMRHYIQKSGDNPPQHLINFYKSYRAAIRALLTIRHLREQQYRNDPKWRRKTLRYLEMADTYLTA
ncbi:hypothetical protein [Fodinibius sediminis]|uniref:Aminoglycoside phosphotransferase family enzyme n=1 Tax=Fodinibius sediminis TaxID=1214077 RepID=A0A521BPM4_9BACT|nr:hypothetical protein [Fodinibius sediminis]SMO49083.1 Aminoglycoside phosphotransferase family enzyme [Fodinibius sediminis]